MMGKAKRALVGARRGRASSGFGTSSALSREGLFCSSKRERTEQSISISKVEGVYSFVVK
jgi:hypothetical protein